MSYLKYNFFAEFEWNKEIGFSAEGTPKIKLYTNPEHNMGAGLVNFEILEMLFISSSNLSDVNYLQSVIKSIKDVKAGLLNETLINSETESLEVKKEFCRPLDNLDMYGSNPKDGNNSWNISTPLNLQYIPTEEILVLFHEWREFILVNKQTTLSRELS